jgi:D-lactate dehydrogenase
MPGKVIYCLGKWDGYYSSNLTCEMGLAAASGLPYRSILYLLEEATRSAG